MTKPTGKPRLMDQVRRTLQLKHYSPRTERTYCYWIRYFIRYSGMRHPMSLAEGDLRTFLEYLAVERNVAASTQNQALNAIVFLYKHVLERPLGDIGEVTRAKRARRLPIVLSHSEVLRVLDALAPTMRLIASLMYGSGLRVTEACRLRVRDIDFDRRTITVRSGKGDKDRTTLLPPSLNDALHARIADVRSELQGVRDPIAAQWYGYSDGAGFVGTQECGNDADLHACARQSVCGCAEPLVPPGVTRS